MGMAMLHIPEGIHYECTGCGNCCLAWPVPVTQEDYNRISELQDPELAPSAERFRELRSSKAKLEAFTHTLEKRADGRCEFLTEDNRCWLHLKYGAAMKPAMCQLFPYTFTDTPSGVYASVSFASTGALLNSGRALTQQAEVLQEKWEQFCRLFPRVAPDWSGIQLVDGYPLDWDEYLQLERELLRIVRFQGQKRIDRCLLDCSRFLARAVPPGTDLERSLAVEARPKMVDQIVVRHLFDLYFPDDVFACDRDEPDAHALGKQLLEPPQVLPIQCGGESYSFKDLNDFSLGSLDVQSEDLLARFAYCRIFSKLYFGAGFANLSLIAGVHHLATLIAMLRFRIKFMVVREQGRRPDFYQVAEILRALERRLTQVYFSREATATLEVLLTSPARVERILSLAY